MQFNYTNAKISDLIIHQVGNKTNEEGYNLSNSTAQDYPKENEYLLINYFLSPFKQGEIYSFWHESELKLNACNVYVKEMFNSKKNFISNSIKIAKHLYECSLHPNIKTGDLYISFFENCILGEDVVNAIGVFKSESRDKFIQTYNSSSHLEIKIDEGFNLEKVDKGCIIFNTNVDNGYKIKIIDNLSRGVDARYWKDDFLKVVDLADEYYNTNQVLTITKKYLTNQFVNEFEVTKADKIDMLNRSMDYFKTHENFEKKEFEKEVFYHPEVIKSFRNFDSDFRKSNDLSIEDSFEISPLAVKKQARLFKSVLKLDKNFHVYIHGNKDLIEKGVDKDGRKFYKIYYENET